MTTARPDICDLVRRLYAALAAGDRAALEEIVHPDFEGRLTEGLPLGLGGVRHGAAAMIDTGWWAIGRAFALRAEPEEWIACADGRLLVLGRYRGRARATGTTVDAAFTHLWTACDGRLAGVWQLTDTAAWQAALGAEGHQNP